MPLFSGASSGARSAGLQINDAAVEQLRSGAESVNLGSVPLITGESANFTLTPMPLFAPDATIQAVGDLGTTTALPIPDIRTWYGRDMRNPSRALFVAANPEGEVRVMVTGDEATSVTVIEQTGSGDNYRIVPAIVPSENFCTPRETGLPDEGGADVTVTPTKRSNVVYEIEMMVDVGYRLYTHLDSDNSLVMNYLTDLFGAVSTIYQRDLNARMRLTYVTIWTAPDPFSRLPAAEALSTRSLTTNDQLDNYTAFVDANRYHARRDLAHFIDYNPLGGIAYLNVLTPYARYFRTGVSNIYNDFGDSVFPEDINTYMWDTMVVAHEIGHNVGSPHTHCFNPPVDCCYRDCPQCTLVKPTAGTIMSYCHLLFGQGGSILMEFHQRCIDMMRPKIENSLLLTPYGEQPDMEVRGIDNGIASNGLTEAGNATILKSPTLGGAPVVETFTIKNIGGANLVLAGNPMVEIIGDQALTIAEQPASGTIAPGESTTFKVSYNPSVDQDQFANIRILSNDPGDPEYKFPVKGRLMQISNPFTFDFNGDVPLPEANGRFTEIPVRVRDVPGLITDLDFRFNGSDCSIPSQTGMEHPWVGDLEIQLVSPMGTTSSLVNHPGVTDERPAGAAGANFCNTLFDDELGSPSIQEVSPEGFEAPYSGTYLPAEPLAKFNGEIPNGFWKVRFYDWAMPDEGRIHSFSLIIRGEAGESAATNKAEDWNLFN